MRETKWQEILINNLNSALQLCRDADMAIKDVESPEWQLKEVTYSPAMDQFYFKCDEVKNG
jgi:hypothetical protein